MFAAFPTGTAASVQVRAIRLAATRRLALAATTKVAAGKREQTVKVAPS